MKKLKLNLTDLKVESFEVNKIYTTKGTIQGNAPHTEAPSNCEFETCWGGVNTCDVSCEVPTCPGNICTNDYTGWCCP